MHLLKLRVRMSVSLTHRCEDLLHDGQDVRPAVFLYPENVGHKLLSLVTCGISLYAPELKRGGCEPSESGVSYDVQLLRTTLLLGARPLNGLVPSGM